MKFKSNMYLLVLTIFPPIIFAHSIGAVEGFFLGADKRVLKNAN